MASTTLKILKSGFIPEITSNSLAHTQKPPLISWTLQSAWSHMNSSQIFSSNLLSSSLSYLHWNSFHPTQIFLSLPYGEFPMARRNCSSLNSYDAFSEVILQAFLKWGYGKASLLRAQQQARLVPTTCLLATYDNLQAPPTSSTSDNPMTTIFHNSPTSLRKPSDLQHGHDPLVHPRHLKPYQPAILCAAHLWNQS